MKYAKAAAGIGLFMVMLLAVYIGYIKLFKVDVVFYASLFTALIATVLVGVMLYTVAFFSVFTTFEKLQLVLICALLGYIFSISLPTLVDRSLSFYILEKLQQRGGGIRRDRFDYIFTSEYMREHRLVDIRLTEQVESGTIYIDDGCVRLTARGEYFASFGRFFRRNLLPKQRLVLNEYTDALTDPFTRSDEQPDYLCGDGGSDD